MVIMSSIPFGPSANLKSSSATKFFAIRTMNLLTKRRILFIAVTLLFAAVILSAVTTFIFYQPFPVQVVPFHKTFKVRIHGTHREPTRQHTHTTESSISSVNDAFAEEIVEFKVVSEPSKNSLLDLTNFTWIRHNPSLCKSSATNKLLPVLVHTARDHFLEREAIRATWGSLKNYKNWTVQPIFLIGEAAPGSHPVGLLETVEKELVEEFSVYSDVITGNFIDSYRNLSYKHIMGYKFILDFCSNVEFVIKSDDDIFVNTKKFIDTRLDNSKSMSLNSDQSTQHHNLSDLLCYEFRGALPLRGKNSKWYVTVEEWPEDTYPLYCSGWGYGITVEWIQKLYLMSFQTKYFWVDDAFIGILLNMAKSFFQTEPRVQRINEWYTFDNRVYKPMCSQNRTGLPSNFTRKFGDVVFVDRGDRFQSEMRCLWTHILESGQLNSTV